MFLLRAALCRENLGGFLLTDTGGADKEFDGLDVFGLVIQKSTQGKALADESCVLCFWAPMA